MPTPAGPSSLHGRPLLDSRADMALYLARPHLESRLDAAVDRGLNVLVTGPRGGGRTTLLRALLFRRRRHGGAASAPVYVRAAAAGSVSDLVRLVHTALLPGAEPSADEGALALVAALGTALRAEGVTDSERRLLCLDDVDPRVGNQLFGVLRDEVWALPVQWVVAADSDGAAALTLPPADAFFETRLDLPELTRAEAERLLALRLPEPITLPETVQRCTPREALDLARLAPDDRATAVDERARRDDAAARLGRPATMLVAALEELGPVSPSDDRLLARTGWTSSRASQVFRQLLDVGLVAYREVRGDRPGRPARLYELTPLRG